MAKIVKKQKVTERAAGFGNTTQSELSSINKLKDILGTKDIYPEIRELDTFPNIDGYLNILDGKHQVPIGKLEVQVKTLNVADWSRKGFSVKRSFLVYCRDNSSLPVILIGVHSKKKEAIWVHITHSVAESLLNSSSGQSVTVKFPEENILTKKKKDFSYWKEIATKNNPILKIVDSLGVTPDKIKEWSDLTSGVEVGVSYDFDAAPVQDFIDRVNYLLDSEFATVKKNLYPEIWKLGIGILNCEEKSLSYTLFAIKRGVGDLLVKRLPSHRPLLNSLKNISSNYVENPIYKDPLKYANMIVLDKLNKLVDAKAFDIPSNEVLESEIIFGGICKNGNLLRWFGLEKKEQYTTEELFFGLNNFFPMYLYLLYFKYIPPDFDKVIKLSLEQTASVKVEDFESFANLAGNFNYAEIKNEVLERFKNGEGALLPFPVYSKTTNLKLIQSIILNYKNSELVKEFSGLYRRAKPERLKKQGSFFAPFWQFYEPQDIFFNVKKIFEELPRSYSEVVAHNFPKIKKEIQFFSCFNLLLVIVEVSSSEEVEFEEPSISIYKAVSHEETTQKVIVLNSSEASLQVKEHNDGEKYEWFLDFDNKRYDIISKTMSGLDQKYLSESPVLTLVMEEIKDRISKYLSL